MQENDLRIVLQRLGIKVESRNEQKKLKRVWLNFKCPVAPFSADHKFKPDSQPSAGAVADSKGGVSVWACHACKSKGSIADLVGWCGQRIPKAGVDYPMLCEEIGQIERVGMATVQFGQEIEVRDELGEPLDPAIYDDLYEPAWDVPLARAYLQKRRISRATAERLELCWEPERKRVMFPVRHTDGQLYGYSQRTVFDRVKPKILDPDLPKRHLILGSHLWRPGLPNLIVEGLFAYARQIENGIDEVANVGALMGSEMTDEKAEMIALTGQPTFLLLDDDPAGQACKFGRIRKDKEGVEQYDPGTGELLRDVETGAVHKLTGQVPLYLPSFPAGKNDPDDLTREEIDTILSGTPMQGLSALKIPKILR